MVSPQPIETLTIHPSMSTSSTKVSSSTSTPLAAPSPIMQASIQKSTMGGQHHHHHPHSNKYYLKRSTSFIDTSSMLDEPQPYLWALNEEFPQKNQTFQSFAHQHKEHNNNTAQSTDQFLADLAQPAQYTFNDDLSQYPSYPSLGLQYPSSNTSHSQLASNECPGCHRDWGSNLGCPECSIQVKGMPLLTRTHSSGTGWPMDRDVEMFNQDFAYLGGSSQDPTQMHWVEAQQYQPQQYEYEEKSMEEPQAYQQQQQQHFQSNEHMLHSPEPSSQQSLPPLSAPLLVGDQLMRVQGKLTRFLPDGSNADHPLVADYVDPNYMTAFEHDLSRPPQTQTQSHQSAHDLATGGRSLRQRKRISRSRTPSPDLSDRSYTPESSNGADSAYETDQYEHEDDEHEPAPSTMTNRIVSSMPVGDDTLSPPVVRYDDASSSSQSSSEPPEPNRLLPVAAKDLLPSRPSTGVVPPAHIKDRLVKSAKRLLTSADGVDDSVQVQVIPIWYPSQSTPDAHKIRLIRVENTDSGSVSVYVHAADVGGVVERKSNISRLFGKFESPSEKLLMRVISTHNTKVGQESNVLTSAGVRKFLQLNKMKEDPTYRHWIETTLLPKLIHDPLVIGEELVEIEASTDPHMPHLVKPKRMKKLEKKQKKLQEKIKETKLVDETPSHHLNKRQKLLHSPLSANNRLAFSPQFHSHINNGLNGGATNGIDTSKPMSHAA